MDSKKHPVWDVYDLFRTARLNVKYYSSRLSALQKCNFWLEIILAISAPSSAIAGFWFWKYPIGALIWKGFAVVAAFISIIKPFLKLSDRIQKFEETLTGYRTLDNDLQSIVSKIKSEKTYNEKIKLEVEKAFDRKKAISTNEPEIRENHKLKTKCEAEVLQELPHNSFFVPEV